MRNPLPVLQPIIKGRGAQINTNNPFSDQVRDVDPSSHLDGNDQIRTKFIDTYPKTIINKIDSPDVGMSYSLNPYQGCEHGCVYCYARNTHTFWGYSAGMDFESKVLIKRNVVELLEKKITSKNWEVLPITLSGNTDCYQPIERKEQITRRILQLLWDYRHPVGIVTKNTLITRDLDILKKMAKYNLINVAISINTLDDKLRQKLEPRTSSIDLRLRLVDTLVKNGIPVTVLAAPIIPGLNDHDILQLMKKLGSLGVKNVHHIVVRLNGDVEDIFRDWVNKTYPDRSQKVLNKIKSLHGGKLSNSVYGQRMKGTGVIGDLISQQFALARRLYLIDNKRFEYNTELFHQVKNPQLSLF